MLVGEYFCVFSTLWQRIQIAGIPLEPCLPSHAGNSVVAERNLRYGNNDKDWAIRSRDPTSDGKDMGKVHRLDVSGVEGCQPNDASRYSRVHAEMYGITVQVVC